MANLLFLSIPWRKRKRTVLSIIYNNVRKKTKILTKSWKITSPSTQNISVLGWAIHQPVFMESGHWWLKPTLRSSNNGWKIPFLSGHLNGENIYKEGIFQQTICDYQRESMWDWCVFFRSARIEPWHFICGNCLSLFNIIKYWYLRILPKLN